MGPGSAARRGDGRRHRPVRPARHRGGEREPGGTLDTRLLESGRIRTECGRESRAAARDPRRRGQARARAGRGAAGHHGARRTCRAVAALHRSIRALVGARGGDRRGAAPRAGWSAGGSRGRRARRRLDSGTVQRADGGSAGRAATRPPTRGEWLPGSGPAGVRPGADLFRTSGRAVHQPAAS